MCESRRMMHERRERSVDNEDSWDGEREQVHDRHSVSTFLPNPNTVKITCKSCVHFPYCMERTRWYPCREFKRK